jgi:hypothetical protein
MDSYLTTKRMKLIKLLGVTACTLALLAGPAFAADDAKEKDKKGPACCEKAKAEGKECTHRCCVAAKKEGKVCESCTKKDAEKKKDAKKE